MLAVETTELTKDYAVGFWRKSPRRALDHLNLRVELGETFGLLGPNGAGKSTTLKLLLGLISPTSGSARILGCDVQDIGGRNRIGFLPENPYFYDHLTAEEFLNYAAELFCLPLSERQTRVASLLERVGLAASRSLPLGRFSKGMVQRLGIAQALINEPELIILDEPMSGLDPLGRREVRDLILELSQAGKTVVFSTHILPDAESVCDRVAILNRGQLQGCGEVRNILGGELATTEVVLEHLGPEDLQELKPHVDSIVRTGDRVRLEVPAQSDISRILDLVLRTRAKIVSMTPVKMSLEDYFMTRVENGKLEIPNSESKVGNLKLGTRNSESEPRRPACESWQWQVEAGRSEFEASPGSTTSRSKSLAGIEPSVWSFKLSVSSFTSRVGSITLHNFKESVRDKVLYNLIVFALLLIGAAILFGSISIGIERVILVNLGLAAISIFGLVMAIFIGIGLVWKEIERRTIYNILSKPLSRAEFILGKYFGLLLTLVVNTSIMTAGFYLALLWQKGRLERSDLAPLEAVYFILLQLALVVGLALLFSCISSPVLSAVFTLCLYVIGHFLNDMRGFGQQSRSVVLEKITSLLYYLLPNFGGFDVITRVAHGEMLPGYVLVANSLYALLYAAILVSAAILVFQEREFR